MINCHRLHLKYVLSYINTDEELAYFEEQIKNYVSTNYSYKEYKYDVNYSIIENVLIATYTVNFSTSENMYYTDIISVGKAR